MKKRRTRTASGNGALQADGKADRAGPEREQPKTSSNLFAEYPMIRWKGKRTHLREVQEVLAERRLPRGYYYYVKGDRRPPNQAEERRRRFRVPQEDRALWMLGAFGRVREEGFASNYYAQIVRNYPLSPLVRTRESVEGWELRAAAGSEGVAWMTADRMCRARAPAG